MAANEVDTLEHDVEASRARLVARVAQMRSPTTVAGVKDELVADVADYKNDAIDRAKQTVADTVDEFVADLKRRAADNPVAVAAIGAGIAWKLWQKPPITTLLVGGGIAALFGIGQSKVREINADPYDPDRPTGYVPGGIAGQGYATTGGQITQKVIGATVFAEAARDKASELRDRASDLAERTLQSATELKDRAIQSAGEIRHNVVHSAAELKDTIVETSNRAVRDASSLATRTGRRAEIMHESAEDTIRENGLYLGIAAIAVGAAAGLGWAQRGKLLDATAEHEDDED